MQIYSQKKEQFETELLSIQKYYNWISLGRLLFVVLVLFSLYNFQKSSSQGYLIMGGIALAGFFILMRWHTQLSFHKKIVQALIKVNTEEKDFLARTSIPFEDGSEFNDFHHPYAYDLDIFGPNSLFQSLNRSGTFMGKRALAKQLLEQGSSKAIEENQKAIQELREKLDWRQSFLATARVGNDNATSYKTIIQWSTFNSEAVPIWAVFWAYAAPIISLGMILGYALTSEVVFIKDFGLLFLVNLGIAGLFLKRILSETSHSSEINTIVHNYGLLIDKIEKETFSSEKLIRLQQLLLHKPMKESEQLKQLSRLFSRMDSTNNFLISILFNGLFLYNIHVLKGIVAWKKCHTNDLEQSLEVIGNFEMLNSLANFSFNNPEFTFPELNDTYQIAFENLSHPLLNPETRVGNTVNFYPQSFLILTGSNMSGKSTFLRSLGVNMVLSGIGAPVCATKAQVHPMPVSVSMRLSDSLTDSESYFFAEIKRLKQIMEALEQRPTFVLLDEILRGTNSDDKRNGTIEVVKKIIGKKAIGAIATHDVEVCLTTQEYPETLSNKCFEVAIVDNELHFDFQLRDGVCQNKSATFLMEKMGVI